VLTHRGERLKARGKCCCRCQKFDSFMEINSTKCNSLGLMDELTTLGCEMGNEQIEFWRGEFGDRYIGRNTSQELFNSNIVFFDKIIRRNKLENIETYIEIGANIGMNIRAINKVCPNWNSFGLEPNGTAFEQLRSVVTQSDNAINRPIQEFNPSRQWDLVLTKTVLIHVTPEDLPNTYKKIATMARNYVLIAEYYNPTPVGIEYRGHINKLFKRDFAGEFISENPDFSLIDYGFTYKGDPVAPQDDITWFLLRRKEN